MNRVRRTWSLPDLLELSQDAQGPARVFLRCRGEAAGHGKCIKESASARHYAEVGLEASPASRLTVSFGHDWLPDIGAARAAELDEALLRGIVEAFARRCYLAAWGCAVRTEFAACGEGTSLLAVQIAAAMATEDMVCKANWTPEAPPADDAA